MESATQRPALPGPVYVEAAVPEPPDATEADGVPDPVRPESAAAADLSALTPARQREFDGLFDLLRCDVRRSILWALAAGGRANVGDLAGRTGVALKTLSHHLAPLRTAGLVFGRRASRHIEYEADPDRVHYERHPDGRSSLSVEARGGAVGVTLTVGAVNAKLEVARESAVGK